MNKGQRIRSLIEQGASDEQIVARVDTTVNSVRWHRSKMRQTPSASKARPGSSTVGHVIDRHNLEGTIRTALGRLPLGGEQVDFLYAQLRRWNFRLNGRALGRRGCCRYKARTLEVRPELIDHPGEFVKTFLHEVAHALDGLIYGRSSGHGVRWRAIMVALGQEPTRCRESSKEAADALAANKMERAAEVWECKRCGHEAPVVRKRKYAPKMYRHKGCGGNFKRIK